MSADTVLGYFIRRTDVQLEEMFAEQERYVSLERYPYLLDTFLAVFGSMPAFAVASTFVFSV